MQGLTIYKKRNDLTFSNKLPEVKKESVKQISAEQKGGAVVQKSAEPPISTRKEVATGGKNPSLCRNLQTLLGN